MAGIAIASEGKDIATSRDYDTRNPHLLVDLESPHLDIITIDGGTAISSSGSLVEEVVATIDHDLGYKPYVIMFYYVVSYDGSTTDPKSARYARDILLYSGTAPTYTDAIFHREYDTKVEIIHSIQAPIAATSDANKYQLKVKYYICSNPIDSHIV